MRIGGIPPHIPILGAIWHLSVQLHILDALFPEKEPPGPQRTDVKLAAVETTLSSSGIQSQIPGGPARIQGTTPTEIFRQEQNIRICAAATFHVFPIRPVSRSTSAVRWWLPATWHLSSLTRKLKSITCEPSKPTTGLIQKKSSVSEVAEQMPIFLKAFLVEENKCLICTPLTLQCTVKQWAWSGIGWLYEWRTSRILPYLWVVSSIPTGQSLISQLHDSASDLSTNHVRRELFDLQGNPDKHLRGIQDSQSNKQPVTRSCHIVWGGATSVTFTAPKSPTELKESVQCEFFVLSLYLRLYLRRSSKFRNSSNQEIMHTVCNLWNSSHLLYFQEVLTDGWRFEAWNSFK